MAEVITEGPSLVSVVREALVRLAKLRLEQQRDVLVVRGTLYTMANPLVRDVTTVFGIEERVVREALQASVDWLDLGALRDDDDPSKIIAVQSDWI